MAWLCTQAGAGAGWGSYVQVERHGEERAVPFGNLWERSLVTWQLDVLSWSHRHTLVRTTEDGESQGQTAWRATIELLEYELAWGWKLSRADNGLSVVLPVTSNIRLIDESGQEVPADLRDACLRQCIAGLEWRAAIQDSIAAIRLAGAYGEGSR